MPGCSWSGARASPTALAEAGLVAVWSADDAAGRRAAGLGFELTWQQLNEAAVAIQRGAHWVATNTDPTRPTERGLVPGNGAAVAAVAMAVQATPEVAGKPYRPLLDDTVDRLGARASGLRGRPAGHRHRRRGQNAGLDSMLVLSGSHGAADLLVAAPSERPTHLGLDLRALLQPPLTVTVDQGRAGAVVRPRRPFATARSRSSGAQPDAPAGIWAAAHAAWSAGRPGPAGRPGDQASCHRADQQRRHRDQEGQGRRPQRRRGVPGPQHRVRQPAGDQRHGVEQQPEERVDVHWRRSW